MPAPQPSDPIDLVDDSDRVVAAVARHEALRRGCNFRTVHVLVVRGGCEVLLQHLAPGRDRHAGLWGSSVAGYLHRGESYGGGAVRRLREELDLHADLRNLGVERMRDGDSIKFVALYVARYDGDPIELDAEQADAVSWWTPQAIRNGLSTDPDLFTPTFRGIFDRWSRAETRPR